MKRPRKRYFHAQGVQNILSVCRDTVSKPGVHVDWKSIIAQYNEDNPEINDDSGDDDDDSDTGSMDGLGICATSEKKKNVKKITYSI